LNRVGGDALWIASSRPVLLERPWLCSARPRFAGRRRRRRSSVRDYLIDRPAAGTQGWRDWAQRVPRLTIKKSQPTRDELARLLLAGLPPVVRGNERGSAAGLWLESSVRYALSEARSPRPGRSMDGPGLVTDRLPAPDTRSAQRHLRVDTARG